MFAHYRLIFVVLETTVAYLLRSRRQDICCHLENAVEKSVQNIDIVQEIIMTSAEMLMLREDFSYFWISITSSHIASVRGEERTNWGQLSHACLRAWHFKTVAYKREKYRSARKSTSWHVFCEVLSHRFNSNCPKTYPLCCK